MIILSGDTHGDIDFQKILSLDNAKLSKRDYLIILGDVEYCWYGDKRDILVQNLYNSIECTVLIVDGNHENFKSLYSYPIIEWHGGKVHRLSNNVYHLMRGQIFDIENQKFFVMGGASSVDKHSRTKNVTWWDSELPSLKEYKEAEKNLDNAKWSVDYVLSHSCGTQTLYKIDPCLKPDALNIWFNKLENKLQYKHWFFGHYHFDCDLDSRHSCLYDNLKIL